jgi:hypothetical protein
MGSLHDTILLKPSNYTGLFDFFDKSVVIISNYYYTQDTTDINNTVLQGGGSRIVFIEDVEDSLFSFHGITFTGGDAYHGGGLWIETCDPAFYNCKFTQNHAVQNGAAAFILQSNARFYDCIFENNDATRGGAVYNKYGTVEYHYTTFQNNHSYADGGAMVNYSSSALIKNCTFNQNTSNYGSSGAIYSWGESPQIINNVFRNNITGGSGGALYHRSGTGGQITNNLFANNHAGYVGGAMNIEASNPLIINNTIVNNTAVEHGGGICLSENLTTNLYNNIFWGNSAGYGSQICLSYEDAQPNFYYNDIQEGIFGFVYINNASMSNYSGNYEDNFDSDPLFIDTVNFLLTSNSPCINAGTLDLPDGFVLPETDLQGNPRINEIIDCGAYEYTTVGISYTHINPDGINISAYPNPFSSVIYFEIELEKSSSIEATIYDIYGKTITNLQFGMIPQGLQKLSWNGRNSNGQKLKEGFYLCNLKINNKKSKTVKIKYHK